MKHWTVVASVVIASSFAACKRPESACPEAKKTAKDALEFALEGAQLKSKQLESAEEALRLEVPRHDDAQKDLEIRLKLFEQSMDCLAKADCCKHLSKVNREDRTTVQSTGSQILLTSSMPSEINTVLEPLAALIEKDSFLGLGQPAAKEAEAWCTSVRATIAKVRTDAPSAWKQAGAALAKDVADAHARVVAQDRQVKMIGEWAGALSRSKSAPVPAGLDVESRELREARTAVAAYQSCR